MSDFHQRAIEDVARAWGIAVGVVEARLRDSPEGNPWALHTIYAVAQRERVLELEAAIKDAAEHLPREYAATVLASVLLFAAEKAKP